MSKYFFFLIIILPVRQKKSLNFVFFKLYKVLLDRMLFLVFTFKQQLDSRGYCVERDGREQDLSKEVKPNGKFPPFIVGFLLLSPHYGLRDERWYFFKKLLTFYFRIHSLNNKINDYVFIARLGQLPSLLMKAYLIITQNTEHYTSNQMKAHFQFPQINIVQSYMFLPFKHLAYL